MTTPDMKLLNKGDRVYAPNPHKEDIPYEDCWVIAIEPAQQFAMVDFADGEGPVIAMTFELAIACENCGGLLVEGCCDGGG